MPEDVAFIWKVFIKELGELSKEKVEVGRKTKGGDDPVLLSANVQGSRGSPDTENEKVKGFELAEDEVTVIKK